ncbi:uncharacterized protein METZ01_LOCUS235441, partial [marine metagenome]
MAFIWPSPACFELVGRHRTHLFKALLVATRCHKGRL